MQFDTSTFLLFLPVVLFLYHLASASYRLQNVVIAVSSVVFYGWFEWRLCFLLFAYAVVGYLGALWIHAITDPRSPARRGALRLVVGVLVLGLAFFKYFGFFTENAAIALRSIGLEPGFPVLEILLPIGISFYCFQSIAYVVDVHRGRVEPERDPINYLAYMFFFAQLIAGPIERADHLLRQFQRPRRVTARDIHEGVWMLLWGFFSKAVAADTLGGYVDVAFQPSDHTTGWVVLLGTLAFTLQVYFDFNAYSLIAKGTGRFFGIDLVWNFDRPYWSTSIQEFWRRWHISLSDWLRDYIYLPLGGGSHGEARAALYLIVTMGLGGLWHGAGWPFVIWGLAHGVALAIHRGWRLHLPAARVPGGLGWALTFTFVAASLGLFRCPSLTVAADLLSRCGRWDWRPFDRAALEAILAVGLPIFLVETYQARRGNLLAPAYSGFLAFSLGSALLLVAIYARFWGTAHRFIYFQF